MNCNFTEKELNYIREEVAPFWMKRVVELEKDVVILIIGEVGSGKSSFGLVLANYLSELQGKEFNMKEQMHYSFKDAEAAILDSEVGTVQVVDELMLAGGYKRRPMSKDNVGLKVLLETCRRKRNIIILILPEIQDLDSAIKKRILHVFRIPDQSYVHFYGKRWSKQFVVDKKYNKLRVKKPMWRGRVRLASKILSPKAWDDYNKFRDNVQKSVRGLEDPNVKRNERIGKMREKGMSLRVIAELEQLSHSTVHDILGKLGRS